MLILLFLVGSVSASEQSDNLQVANETDTVSAGEDAVVSVSESTDVLQDKNIGTYSDLVTLIKATDSGGILYLENDYAYDESVDSDYVKGIDINKVIAIDGQGHTINGMNKSAIINVNANNVIIKNITITNTTKPYHAISWYGESGQLCDATLKDITSVATESEGRSVEGAAVHWFGKNGYILNTLFNNITEWRGALGNTGVGLQVINSTFLYCNATQQGSAAYIRATTTFKGCYFMNLYANNCAIAIDGGLNTVIDNCTFKDLTDAVYCYDGPFNLTNCIFENYVTNGTIDRYNRYLVTLSQGSNILNCSFKNITLIKNSGLIYAPGLNVISYEHIIICFIIC